jgi:aminoglycoside phosphotransferase (APT) family kinase protein
VLRVHTGAGDFYFKAVARSIRRECAITACLAERLPYAVPAIVAVDLDRRWLLLHAARGRKLEDIGTSAHWEQAARMYGRLQVESAGHVESLRACGASERGLEELTRRLDRLAEEHDELRAQLPTLRSCAARLAAYGIPPLLEHGDLWPGNFLVGDAGCVLIDWEDAAIGHPFFSLAPLLVGWVTYLAASQRIGMAMILPFLIVGALILMGVDVRRAAGR